MTTSLTTKFAALALALVANSVLMGSVAYLFNAHTVQTAPMFAEQLRQSAVVA